MVDNIQTRLIKYFDSRGEVDLVVVEEIAEIMYKYYSDLDERLRSCEAALNDANTTVKGLTAENTYLNTLLRETIIKYQDIIAGTVLQQNSEKEFSEREAREREV